MLSRALVRTAHFVQTEFWFVLLLAVAAAFVFPDFGRQYLKPLALPAILAQMYVVMLNIEPGRLAVAFRDWAPLTRALGLMFGLTPLLALVAAEFYEPALVLGFAVVCSMPAGMSSPFFALQAGGDAALAVAVTTISHLLVPVLAPLLVKATAGGVLEVDAGEVFLRLVQLVVLPFLLAWATRRLLGDRRTAKLYSRVGWSSGLFVVLVTWGIVAEITVATVPVLPIVAGVALINGAVFAAGYALGGRLRKTLAITTGYRNVTLGMVLSISVWTDPRIALPSIVWTLTHNGFAILILLTGRILSKRRS